MVSQTQLQELLTQQRRVNDTINAYWVEADYPFERSIALVASAAVAEGGWAWLQHRDPSQVRAALGGIWRCVISRCLADANRDPIRAAASMTEALADPARVYFDLKSYSFDAMNTVQLVELLGALALAKRLYLPLMTSLMDSCKITWPQLLNHFESARREEMEFPLMRVTGTRSGMLAAVRELIA